MVDSISYKDPEFGKKFLASLVKTGFAVVRDHGLNEESVEDAYKYWAAFYGCKDGFKSRFKFDPSKNIQGGYFPFKSENAKDQKVSDLKEFFHSYRDSDPVLLPAETLGVTEPFEYQNPLSVLTLFHEMEQVGIRLLKEINNNLPNEIYTELSMDLEVMAMESPATLLRSIHYPPIKDADAAEGAVRAAAHEDINLITLLPAATDSGLEVKDSEGNWHRIEASGNDLVVNVGDMMELATKGYLKSTTHRVVNTTEGKTRSRYSMPMFMYPWPKVPLSSDKTAGQYLEERLKEIGLKK